jgi:hypothetical protein
VRRLSIDSVAETEVEHSRDGLLESRRETVVGRGQMASRGVPFIGRAPGPTGSLGVKASAQPCSDSTNMHAWAQTCREADSGRGFEWRRLQKKFVRTPLSLPRWNGWGGAMSTWREKARQRTTPRRPRTHASKATPGPRRCPFDSASSVSRVGCVRPHH